MNQEIFKFIVNILITVDKSVNNYCSLPNAFWSQCNIYFYLKLMHDGNNQTNLALKSGFYIF